MKRKFTLKKNHEFQKIIKKKIRKINHTYYLFYQKNNFIHYRFGLSVGKKLGNAVLRNKTKRQLRGMLYEFNFYNNDKNYDVVIIVRPNFFKNSFTHNKTELLKLLKQI